MPSARLAALVANRDARPLASLASTTDTSNARSRVDTVAVTGMRSPSGEVAPGRSPLEASQARVEAMVAVVGPNSGPNWPGPR